MLLRAAGCALAGATILLATPARAQTSCNASNRYSFNFSSRPDTQLNYASSYTYNATNGLAQTRQFTLSFFTNGLSSSQISGEQMPQISNFINGGGTGNALVVGGVLSGRTANIASNTRVMVTRFTFAAPVREFSMTVHDIDYNVDQFRDWLAITGTDGTSTYNPVLTTPFGQTSGTGNTHSSGSSSLRLGPETTPLAIAVNQAVGVGSSGNNSTTGNVTMSFAQPVTQIELRYGNFPFNGSDNSGTGQQGYAVSALSFCPMPSIAVAKTSAPLVTTGIDRFAAPAAQMVYTITVTNSGGSTVDSNSNTVVDLLPSQVSFVNGSYGGAGMPILFTANGSGLTLSAANVSYSNNGGASFAYTPTSGADPNVNAIRIRPQGTMAANSSYSAAFLAQIE